jgi:PAS domain S-box-containing protein
MVPASGNGNVVRKSRSITNDGGEGFPTLEASGHGWIERLILRTPRRGPFPRYGIAVLAVAATLGLRLLLHPILGTGSPFLAFTLAVLVASGLGGWGPGLLALALSILASDYFFLTPQGQFGLSGSYQVVQVGLFLGIGVLICAINNRLVSSAVRVHLANEALGLTEERFRLLVEGISDYALFLLDPQGRIVVWNPAAERIYGYGPEEVLGRSYEAFFTPEEASLGLPRRHLQQAAEWGTLREEGWRVRRDGSRFWAENLITALRGRDGGLRGFAKIVHDATERRLADEEIQRLNESLERRVEERTAQLEEANKALEAFTYTVSHDLRAPLRGIQGFSEALLEDAGDQLDDTGREYARRIVSASNRMEGLIQDLLTYSRLSRAQVDRRTVDLDEAVEEAWGQIRESSPPGTRLEIQEPLPEVTGHRSTLVQVLANLLGNAVKFVPPGQTPEVRVRAEEADGRARLWIEDQGIGIAPEHQERIFNVFERLHGGESYPGTGIGLAIVRKGMERMGGQAGVESQPGEGARFWIELPRAGEGE